MDGHYITSCSRKSEFDRGLKGEDAQPFELFSRPRTGMLNVSSTFWALRQDLEYLRSGLEPEDNSPWNRSKKRFRCSTANVPCNL